MTQAGHALDVHPQPGDRVGSYTLVEWIGSGGSSVVWRAQDPITARVVAIKHLFPRGGSGIDAAFRRRFAQEAAIMQRIGERHSGVVQLIEPLDLTESDRGPAGLFLVMEHVEGSTLESRLRDGEPLNPTYALRLIAAVAAVLDSLHRQDILHRDLKPSNVLLPGGSARASTDGESGPGERMRVKLCDLGLASLVSEQEAMTIGSVRYMSPELLRGEPGDARSDLYSLGIMAYEMLAGRSAFDKAFQSVQRRSRGSSPDADASLSEKQQHELAMRWMRWHTNARLAAPSLSTLNPRVPENLAALVARLMDKDPARRVRSAAELLKALELNFSNSVQARAAREQLRQEARAGHGSPLLPGATADLPRRRPGAVVYAASAVIAASLIAMAVWLYLDLQTSAADTQRLTRLVQAIDEGIAHLRDDRYAEALDRFTAGLAIETPAERPEWQDSAAHARAGAALARGFLALDEDRIDEARQALRRVRDEDVSALAGDVGLISLVQRLDRAVTARQRFLEARDEIEAAIAEGKLRTAQAVLDELARHGLSPQEAAEVQDYRTRLKDQQRRSRLAQSLQAVDALLAQGRRDEARDRLVLIGQRHGDSVVRARLDSIDRDERIEASLAQAEDALAQGDREQAAAMLDRAVRAGAEAAIKARRDRLLTQTALERGRELLRRGRLTEANAAFATALSHDPQNAEARAALRDISGRERAEALVNAGDAAAASAQWNRAVVHYSEALAISNDPQVSAKLEDATARSLLAQGDARRDAGELNEALSLYTQALEISPSLTGAREALDQTHRRVVHDRLIAQGDEHRAASRFAPAKQAYRRALEALPTATARQRLNETEYDHLLAMARGYAEVSQWNAAHASLLTALGIRETDEARELLAEIAPRVDEDLRREP